MSYVVLSPKAEQIIGEEISDSWLLQSLTVRLEEIAAAPTRHTEPAASPPFRPDRLMANFELEDAAGRTWTFVVLLLRLPDEEGIFVHTLRIGPPPDDDFF